MSTSEKKPRKSGGESTAKGGVTKAKARSRAKAAAKTKPVAKSRTTAKAKPSAPKSGAGAAAGDRGYTVLARKYRPATFDELIGQDAMVQTLRNAFETGRIAQAYMLTGVRGVGKTTTARILARALNYTGTDGPSVEMPERGEHCQAIMESRHVDVLEMDAASHTGIDDIREIIESARYLPVSARTKVYIIDEVHMLSKAAFNGLLKTLEEPPEHVKFIFATTEIRKVPVTVLSRCQRFDLHRVDTAQLIGHFGAIAKKEAATVDEDALALIARAAEGSVRDGLSILDQAIAHGSATITAGDVRSMLGLADRGRVFDLLEVVMKGEAGEALLALEALHRDGAEPARVVADLAEIVHIITRTKVVAGEADVSLSETERARAGEMADKLSMPVLARAWQMLLKGLNEVNQAPHQLAAAEMILVRLAYAAALPSPEELARSIKSGNGAGKQVTKSGNNTPATPQGGPAPQMSAAGGGAGVSPVAQPALLAEKAPETMEMPRAAPGPRLETFADVVALAGQKRELQLRLNLEEHVRLVRFQPGSIEFAVTPQAPKNLANDLGRKLHDWTGERWLVAISNEQGEETIAARRQAAEAARLEKVKDHPLVKAVFAQFPDARITGIRDLVDEKCNDADGDEQD